MKTSSRRSSPWGAYSWPRWSPLWQVVAGTTIGMLLANVPVVLLGARFAHRLPLRAARWTAAVLFAALALWVAVAGLPAN